MSKDADKKIGGEPDASPVPVPAPAPAASGPGPNPTASGPAKIVLPASPPVPIEYAMPAQSKSWLPSPALIKNLGCIIKMLFGFTVLLVLAYVMLMAMNPKARLWATQGGGPTPIKAINQILAIPAQAVGKTTDVVVANDARVGTLDRVIAEEEGKGRKAGTVVLDPFASPSTQGKTGKTAGKVSAASEEGEPRRLSAEAILAMNERLAQLPATGTDPVPTPTPAKAAPESGPRAPTQLKLAGDIIITSASPAGTPPASAAFFYWVVNLNISGVIQSKPARLLLNNRLVYEEQEVNRPLGIVFARLDVANKLLVFRDGTGAVVTRSY